MRTRRRTVPVLVASLIVFLTGCSGQSTGAEAKVLVTNVAVRIALSAVVGPEAPAVMSIVGNTTGIGFQPDKVLQTLFTQEAPTFGAPPKAPVFSIIDKSHNRVLTWQLTKKVAEIDVTPAGASNASKAGTIPVQQINIINKSPLQILVWVSNVSTINIQVHLK